MSEHANRLERLNNPRRNKMRNWKLIAAKYANSTTLRLIYILVALLAMALAGGAPSDFGGH